MFYCVMFHEMKKVSIAHQFWSLFKAPVRISQPGLINHGLLIDGVPPKKLLNIVEPWFTEFNCMI